MKREPEQTAYERWGGEPFFTALVERFYAGVAADPLLRPMYPEDLTELQGPPGPVPDAVLGRTPALQRAAGASAPQDAPRPVRHRYRAQADAWLRHMTDAVHGAGLAAADEEELLDYLPWPPAA